MAVRTTHANWSAWRKIKRKCLLNTRDYVEWNPLKRPLLYRCLTHSHAIRYRWRGSRLPQWTRKHPRKKLKGQKKQVMKDHQDGMLIEHKSKLQTQKSSTSGSFFEAFRSQMAILTTFFAFISYIIFDKFHFQICWSYIVYFIVIFGIFWIIPKKMVPVIK